MMEEDEEQQKVCVQESLSDCPVVWLSGLQCTRCIRIDFDFSFLIAKVIQFSWVVTLLHHEAQVKD
jgi:hypothetical protein